MDKKTAQDLIEKTFNNAFSEERFTVFAKNLLNDLEDKDNRYSGNLIWDDFKEHINSYKRIGKYIDPEGQALDVLIVEVKSVTKLERARTVLRNFVIKHLSKFEKDYALVAFYSKEDDGADWRFSFIKLEYRSELDEAKGKVRTKKEFTPAKRYSFLVGKYEKAHTAKNQLLPLLQNISNNPTIEELEAAFSIEKVTDEFFNQYKDLYIKLYEHFESDGKVKAALKDAGIDKARFTKKLLGQIVFLYFLQKKGWLGVAQNARWGTGKKRFVQELFEQAQKEKVNFFKDKLQYLFYEALAQERDNVNSYYKRFDCRIPFLNGGLFEADYEWEKANIAIPENLFRNEEKNKAGDVGTGILDVFDRYNFTIKEDEPLDKEVAVDPEMLGKVFENMLDITERKSKGAFYTPREIVHYMCQESLIHYLDNALNSGTSSYQAIDSSQLSLMPGSADKKGNLKIELERTENIRVPKKDIETFIREGHFALENDERVAAKGETKTYQYQLPESIRKNADLIDKHLSSIKICDPAIGSGAFPVGLLHELVNAMLALKPHLSYDYLTEKLKGFGFTHRESISDSRYIYRLKRHIIQESIYGVDIDSSAIDIARLRLWLSLVVDEDDLDPIETLPNLDYKIVCGNSLIGLPDGAMRNLVVEAELEKLKEKFYDITDEKEKKALRQKINTKIRELLDSAEQFAGYKIDFDFKLFFSEVWREKGGFDVVIGNPPYGVSIKGEYRVIVSKQFEKVPDYEIYYYFIELSKRLLRTNGTLTYIIPNTILFNVYANKYREEILKYWTIQEIIDCTTFKLFESAVVRNIILLFTKTTGGTVVGYRNTFDSKTFKDLITVQREFLKLDEIQIFSQNWALAFKLPKSIVDVIKKIKKGKKQLIETNPEISQGLIAYDSYRGQSKEIIESRAFHYTEYKNGLKKWLLGEDVTRYRVRWNGQHYIDYCNGIANPRDPKYFIGNRVLVREITNPRVFAAFTNEELYNDPAVLIVKESIKGLDVYSLTAILNSDVVTFLHFNNSPKATKGDFPKILITDLKELPVVKPSEAYKETLKSYINYIILLVELSKNDTVLVFFDQLVNSLVFELYFPEEIKSAGKEILKHLGDLKPITDDMSEEEKLAIIQSERLYDPNHPVRFAIETLDSVEEVRIIKEALK
jgi:predicted RNA methylase